MIPRNDLRERTKRFALSVIRMFSSLPKTTEAQVLGKQVLRSGTSMARITAKRFADERRPEFIAKCGDCLREIEETAYWLELIVDAGIASALKLAPLRQEIDELTAIFVTILKHTKE